MAGLENDDGVGPSGQSILSENSIIGGTGDGRNIRMVKVRQIKWLATTNAVKLTMCPLSIANNHNKYIGLKLELLPLI